MNSPARLHLSTRECLQIACNVRAAKWQALMDQIDSMAIRADDASDLRIASNLEDAVKELRAAFLEERKVLHDLLRDTAKAARLVLTGGEPAPLFPILDEIDRLSLEEK